LPNKVFVKKPRPFLFFSWLSPSIVGFLSILFFSFTPRAICEDSATVSILTPHTEEVRNEFSILFQNWYREKFNKQVFLDWRNVGGSSDTLRFIRSEYASKPEGIGLDVLFGCGVDPYYDLKMEGILASCPLGNDTLLSIPASHHGTLLRDPDSYWYGVTIATFGILHNLRVLEYNALPQARRWNELTNPKLQGWISLSDPRNSGSMYSMMEAILQSYGWERGWRILTGMAANSESIGRYATDPPRQTTYGNSASSICIDFYGFTQVSSAGKENMLFVIPEDFSVLSPDCIALLKGAPQPDVAKRFIELVLSEEGQKVWMLPVGVPGGPSKSSLFRMPVRKDVYENCSTYSPLTISPYESHKGTNEGHELGFQFNSELAYKRRDLVCALIGAQLIDTHRELSETWVRAIKAGKSTEALEQLGAPLISEEELGKILQKEWTVPTERNRLKIFWQKQAQDRYRALKSMF
jgi:ABC-type Fe3+ transport system substrate-binding protein